MCFFFSTTSQVRERERERGKKVETVLPWSASLLGSRYLPYLRFTEGREVHSTLQYLRTTIVGAFVPERGRHYPRHSRAFLIRQQPLQFSNFKPSQAGSRSRQSHYYRVYSRQSYLHPSLESASGSKTNADPFLQCPLTSSVIGISSGLTRIRKESTEHESQALRCFDGPEVWISQVSRSCIFPRLYQWQPRP